MGVFEFLKSLNVGNTPPLEAPTKSRRRAHTFNDMSDTAFPSSQPLAPKPLRPQESSQLTNSPRSPYRSHFIEHHDEDGPIIPVNPDNPLGPPLSPDRQRNHNNQRIQLSSDLPLRIKENPPPSPGEVTTVEPEDAKSPTSIDLDWNATCRDRFRRRRSSTINGSQASKSSVKRVLSYRGEDRVGTPAFTTRSATGARPTEEGPGRSVSANSGLRRRKAMHPKPEDIPASVRARWST